MCLLFLIPWYPPNLQAVGAQTNFFKGKDPFLILSDREKKSDPRSGLGIHL